MRYAWHRNTRKFGAILANAIAVNIRNLFKWAVPVLAIIVAGGFLTFVASLYKIDVFIFGMLMTAMALLLMVVMLAWHFQHQKLSQHHVDALSASEHRYQELIETIPVGIALHQKGRLSYLNPSFLKILGLKHIDDIEDKTLLNHVHPDDRKRVAKEIQRSMKKHEIKNSPVRLLTKDSKHIVHEILLSYSSTIIEKERISVMIALDVTERVQAALEREKVQKKVEDAQHLESLGLLSGGIAHDFNNLLAVILGNAALADKHLNPDSKEKLFMSRIQQASEKAADLCRQMLAYAGKGKFAVKFVNLSEVVQSMTSLMEVSLFKHVKVAYQLEEDLSFIEVDTAQIQQLVMNLITNANEAMQDSGGIIRVSTGEMLVNGPLENTVGDEDVKDGKYVFIEVIDEGCGMDAETINRIFEPFFTTKFTGRGLGMSAMLGTVKSHKGVIQIQSIFGEGTRFNILFPAVDNVDVEIIVDEKIEPHFIAAHRQGKILIVDDEEVVLETMQVILEDLGYETLLAHNGKQALEVYSANQQEISLVLMDMTMPEMSGKDCMIELLKINPEVQVILSSGYTEDDISKQFKGLNLAGIVQKPCDMNQLHQAITKVMGF